MITPFFSSLIVYAIIGVPSAIYDVKRFRISFFYVGAGYVFLGLCVVYGSFYSAGTVSFEYIKPYIVSVITGLMIYLMFYIFSAGKISKGDVFFGVFTCLYMSFPYSLIATGFAGLICIIYYLFFAIRHTAKKGRPIIFRPIFAIPFVPFIFAGALIVRVLFTFLR